MIDRKFVTEWIDKYKKAWLKKDIKYIVEMFSKVEQYFETPFEETTNQIIELWQGIKEQNIQRLDFKILAIENNIAIIEWELEEDGIHNGIYEMKFNDNLECIYFKQWFMKGEKSLWNI